MDAICLRSDHRDAPKVLPDNNVCFFAYPPQRGHLINIVGPGLMISCFSLLYGISEIEIKPSWMITGGYMSLLINNWNNPEGKIFRNFV